MAAFTPPFGLGIAFEGVIPSAGLNKINVDLPKCMNMVDGGATYNPLDLVQIGGAGVRWNTTVYFSSGSVTAFETGSSVTIAATVEVNSGGVVNVNTGAALDLETGSNLNVRGGAQLNVLSAGSLDVENGGQLNIANGGLQTILTGGVLTNNGTINSNSAIALKTGSTFTGEAGSTITTSEQYRVSSRSVTRWQQGSPEYKPTEWELDTTTGRPKTAVTGAGPVLLQPVDVPHGSTITGYTVRYKGGPGHAALPAVMPNTVLRAYDLSGAVTSIGSQVDTMPTVGTFEATHSIAKTGLSHVVDRSLYQYKLAVVGESLADSEINALFYGASVTTTITTVDETT